MNTHVHAHSFSSLKLDTSRIMGVVNVTPDSFSDGGRYLDHDRAIQHGLDLLKSGADILDVGGQSTRPGAAPVFETEELSRIIPVVEALSQQGAIVSVDTYNAAVMTAAIKAGAKIINDVTALSGDLNALHVASESRADVVLMHMQGGPTTMQNNPNYENVVADVYDYLKSRVAVCIKAGIDISKIAIDPGIGFGKTLDHNLALLSSLDKFHSIGCPMVLGASRKSFVDNIAGAAGADQRLAGSIAAVIAGASRGVQIFRVHDVYETRQALMVFSAIEKAGC